MGIDHVRVVDGQAERIPLSAWGGHVEPVDDENIPVGWRARETYILTGTYHLEEIFELAPPSKEFEPYSRSRLTRVR